MTNKTVVDTELHQQSDAPIRPCGSCGASDLQLILKLGEMPLANALLTSNQLDTPEPSYPLNLAFCPSCALVQITHTVPPEKLFSDYPYFSSFSTTMLRHAKESAMQLIKERNLNAQSLVIEAASNDGYFLQYFKEAGIPVLGIEPAANIAEIAMQKKGIPTVVDFLGESLAAKLAAEGKKADVILANNVMAHVENLNGFAKSIKLLLKENGVAVIEVPYVKAMIDRCEFDTIYHEHVYYFSTTAVHRLFANNGLSLSRIQVIPIHGGSLRLFVTHPHVPVDPTVKQFLLEEKAAGMTKFDYYKTFSRKVENLKETLFQKMEALKKAGKKIAAYGAAAKGTVLLNYSRLDTRYLDFVVDRSTYKQGRFMPGVHLPIHPPERLMESKPDYVLLLTWNFAEEILEQQKEYRKQGGRFIIPVPELMIIE